MIKKRFLIPTTCLILLALIYGLSATAVPTGQADSDELITAAYFNSVAHPPGFPLFIFISHYLMKLLFFLPPAQAANYIAGFYQAAATVIFGYLVRLFLSHQKKDSVSHGIVASTACGMLAFSYFWWLYGTVFEIFSFTTLLTLTTLWFAFRWYYQPQPTLTYNFWLTWITAGVLVGHLQLALLLLPGLAVMYVQKMVAHKTAASHIFWSLIKGAVCFVTAFTLSNAILFIQTNHNQVISWGMEPTIAGWFNHLTRKDYTGFNLEQNLNYQTAYVVPSVIDAVTLQSIAQYISLLIAHFGAVGMILFILGMLYLWKTDKNLACILTVLFALCGIFLAGYMRLAGLSFQTTLYTGVGERQFAMSESIVALIIAFGIYAFYSFITRFTTRQIVFIGISAGLVTISFWQNLTVVTRRQSRTVTYQLARNRLVDVPTNSLIICSTDIDCYSLFYVHDVEKFRPDVTVLPHVFAYKVAAVTTDKNLYPYTDFAIPDYLANLISWNVPQRPVYLASGINYYADYIGLETGPFYLQPWHSLFQITTSLPATIAAEPIPAYLTTPNDPKNNYAQGVINAYANSLAYAGYLALRYQYPEAAHTYLVQSLQLDPTNRQTYQLQEQQQQIATAMKVLQDKTTAADYLTAAGKVEQTGAIDAAELLYRQSTYLDPSNITVLTRVRDFYLKYNAAKQASILNQHIGIIAAGMPR